MNSFVCLLVIVGVAAVSAQLSNNVDDLNFVYYSGPSSRYSIVHNNPSSLTNSPFKQGSKTVIVIDGFLSNETSQMSQSVKDMFLARGSNNKNVIVLDWGHLSGSKTLPHSSSTQTNLMYTNVLNNVGPVGQRLADFINFLRENRGIEFSNVHIVGMSLGAHIAGAAGNFVQRNHNGLIGRITGLDPAGPMFSSQTDPNKRLEKTDAAFVDIYHTNRGSLGDSAHQTGDINVYINGGDNQPGCEGLNDSGLCSHSYAFRVFVAAATRNFAACPCSGTQCQCSDCQLTCSTPITLGPDTPTSATGAYHIRAVL